MMRCRLSLFAAGVLLIAAQPVPAQTPSDSTWQQQAQKLLTARAAAVQKGDLPEFTRTMRGAPAPFVKARRQWFDRIRTLPLGSYSLTLAQDQFGDLALPADTRNYKGDVHIVQVKERIAFKGFDRSPAEEDLFLTLRNSGGAWSVVADTDRENLFLMSMRNIWDFGPVQTTSRSGILVITHPAQRSAASTILSDAIAARTTARKRWPYPWRDPIIIMVPSTVSELARVLQTQFDLSSFVAFASSSLTRDKDWSLTGDRVFLHWSNYSRYDTGYRRLILDHEFTHLATRAATGPYVQSFMDEGTAQYYGEAAAGNAAPYTRTRVRSGRFTGRVPEDWFFTAGPPEDIYLAYELSLSFITYLGKRFGHNAGARAYQATAAEKPVSPGTWRYHQGLAFRRTFGVGFESLERGWADATRKAYR
ncbi:MAG: hypothetical protein ABR548_03640 [Actinomycetota bacterium]|nr:hypothetical protein [Actinomycetota bacterium]